MIVRRDPPVLHLITQPDHAALARTVMEHWHDLADRPRRDSILLAIGEHDNGWREPDAAPMIDPDSGRIADFINIAVSVRQGVWPRGIMRLAQHSWAAALVAQHAIFVYDRYRADPAWADFFRELEELRDSLIAAAGLGLDDLRSDYFFVRMGDLISLVFCTGWTDPQHYEDYTIVRRDARVEVTPDPFEGAIVPMTIAARALADRPFRSDSELREAVQAAPTVTLNGEVHPRH